MLDKSNIHIVKVLNQLLTGNAFKVVELKELVDKLSGKVDVHSLKTNLKYLSEQSFVDIKYMDEKEVMIALLPKGRIVEEASMAEKQENAKFYSMCFWFGVICACSAFLGGFLAYLIFT